MTLLGFILW